MCQSVRLLPESVIPPHALKGHQAVLRCDYDMEGDDLYSVKWYFNQKEFYRFIPSDNPKVTIFNHHKGVKVNVSIYWFGYSTGSFFNTNWNSNVLESSDSLSFEAKILEFQRKIGVLGKIYNFFTS